jgi:hypothetical protein
VSLFPLCCALSISATVQSKRERLALVHGSDTALQRGSVRGFFTSTPFLLFVLLLLMVAVSFAFLHYSQTEVKRMNEPPPTFKAPKMRPEQVPYQQPQAIQY